jgi:[protein-PII] uridylyltransferase
MRDYYHHTNNLYQRSQELVDTFYLEERESRNNAPIIVSFLARGKKFKEEKFDGFLTKNNRVYAENKNIFKENHHRLMRLFQHTQLRHLRMSPELFQLVQANYDVINATFRYSRTNRETFEAILSRRGDVARSLRQMHRVGVLGKYIPEFGALTNLVQHEFFHRYTADEHTLRVVEQLDDLVNTEDPKKQFYSDLFHKIEDPYILYLAIIMHDTGRAANQAHHDDASAVFAANVAQRMRMISYRRKRFIFLVESHLELWRTATTRNLDDPKTIIDFARIVKKQKNLDDLLLLTYADSKGTNSEGWTDWKESLIRQLYRATSHYLADSVDYVEKATIRLDKLVPLLSEKLGEEYSQEIITHLEHMPERYFRFRESHMIAAHVRLCRRYRSRQEKAEEGEIPAPVVKWKPLPDQGCSRLTIVSSDRPKLLATIAGALAAEQINVIGADAFYRMDGLVLDIFRVCTTNFEPVTSDSNFSHFEKTLNTLLETEAKPDFAAFAKRKNILNKSETPDDIGISIPQRAYVNNDIHPDYSVIEIQALDRLGLLYDIFGVIADFQLDITNSRISTTRGAAIDSFFVVDKHGKKITDRALVDKIEIALIKAIAH